VCGATRRRFARFGDPPRKGARCPECGSLERHRFVWKYLLERTELLPAGSALLHLAPEPFLAAALRRDFRIRHVTADMASPLAGSLHDLTRLGFAEGCFDGVLCLHVLEHVVDDGSAMTEMRRVLRPGGWALVHVPLGQAGERTDEDPSVTDPATRRRRWGQEDHVRLYGLDIVDRLESAGFSVQLGHCADLWDRATVVREALTPGGAVDDVLLLARAR